MASLHPAAGAPAAFDPRVFAATQNPFLRAEPETPRLPPALARGALAESLEVTVLWGTNVLSVAELTPPRGYAVGEVGGARGAGTSALGRVDFALSSERLGSARRELVVLRAGVPYAIFVSNETPRVFEQGREVDAATCVVNCTELGPEVRGIALELGRTVSVEATGVTFRIAGCERPERVPRAGVGVERSALATMGTAAVLQGLLVASLAYLTPNLAWGVEDELDKDRLDMMQQYLHASAQREEEARPAEAQTGGGEKGAPAERSRGPEGAAGSPTAKAHARMAIQGRSDNRVVSRAEMVKEAQEFGTIGLLSVLNASTSPSSPWGDIAQGADDVNAVGDLFSRDIGEGIGSGGLGLSGPGQGGGGKGVGVGMGNIGTCMGLNCYGNGDGGFARSSALGHGGHQTKAPRIGGRTEVVSGRLPADVIQRVVRQNFGRFRQCYEVGLRSNPNLEGRVVARFVIGRDGAVSNVSASGDLPDSQVRSCVASAFYGLSFPAPEMGIVTVSYPIMLMPG